MNILGIIPVKSTSRRLPKKNQLDLDGKPLFYYTIKSAKQSKLLNKIVVSTDDENIANSSRKFGADVPFIRKKSLSRKNVTNFQVIKNLLKNLESDHAYIPDIVVLLQPTSPIRSCSVIDKTIKKLISSKASSAITVKEINISTFFKKNKKYLIEVKENLESPKNFTLYIPTGSVYVFWNRTIKQHNSIYGPKIIPMITKNEENLDIDTLYDFFTSYMTKKYWKSFQKNFLKHTKN